MDKCAVRQQSVVAADAGLNRTSRGGQDIRCQSPLKSRCFDEGGCCDHDGEYRTRAQPPCPLTDVAIRQPSQNGMKTLRPNGSGDQPNHTTRSGNGSGHARTSYRDRLMDKIGFGAVDVNMPSHPPKHSAWTLFGIVFCTIFRDLARKTVDPLVPSQKSHLRCYN